MNNTRLGCVTPAGLVAGGLTLLVVLGFTLLQGGVIFSPGELNSVPGSPLGGYSAHAEFAGECKLCHAPFWDSAGMSSRCANCHSEIPTQQSDPATLHGALFAGDPSLECRECHPEHRGPEGILTDFHGEGFPHFVLGFSLNGHARTSKGFPFKCADCHDRDFSTFSIAVCQDCHTEVDPSFTSDHVLSFGSDCLNCHDGIDSYGSDFDHNRFLFPLNGTHVDLPCSNCHIDARSVPELQSAPVDCFSCHAKDDTHSGELGTDCGSCHSPEGWSPAKFDHSLAVFQLEGKHVEVLCESCHIDYQFKNTPTECNSCHAGEDVHQGKLGINCQSCHTPAGWTPVNFDHQLSVFKLTGQHVTTTCDACHKNQAFKGTPTDCFSCHSADDAHQGSLGMGCSTCHTTIGWSPATFDHNLATFKLTGQHVTTTCDACHKNQAFKGTPTDCFSCHSGNDTHQGSLGTSCGICHTSFGWKPATFDHNLSAFKLTGKHSSTSCISCHNNNVFKGTPSTCYSCHAGDDTHQGKYGISCNSCHSTSGWKPASFDHNLSGFPLTGAHVGLPCTSCHTGGTFIGLSSSCSACHGEPAFHAGLFTAMSCSQCHNTNSWIPASYNLSHPGDCDGPCINHEGATCHDCHTTNLSSATCLKCHDSNNPED